MKTNESEILFILYHLFPLRGTGSLTFNPTISGLTLTKGYYCFGTGI